MKLKVTSVEMRDPTTSNDGLYTVVKVAREVQDTPGEKVNPVPQFIEVYKGNERKLAIEARNKAQQDMMTQ